MAVATVGRKTRRDYEALEEGAPYQLINGQLIVSPSPSYFHQLVSMRLSRFLDRYVTEHGLGRVVTAPLDIHLRETEIYQPDILYISNERSDIIQERIEGAPDLIVEILSPATAYYDLRHKRRIYQEENVLEYWIVDPMDPAVEVFWNAGETYERHEIHHKEGTAKSRLLESFSVDLTELFAQ